MPDNEDYNKNTVLKHLDDTFIMNLSNYDLLSCKLEDGTFDSKGDPWTWETLCSEFIPQKFIHSRSLLLGGLADGLSVDGTLDASAKLEERCGELSEFLANIPLEAVQKALFSNPVLTFEEVWGSMSPGKCIVCLM
jgi:hypothetical protein